MAKNTYGFLRRQQENLQIRRITEWNRDEFSAFLQDPDAYTKESNAAVAFGAYRDDKPSGAVELTSEEGYIGLWSVFVEESKRRGGIGTALLDRAKEFAAEMDVDRIRAEFVSDSGNESAELFLEAGDFAQTEAEDSILLLQPDELLQLSIFGKMAARGLPGDAVSLKYLSAQQREKLALLKSRFGELLSLPQDDRGQILADLSMGCPDEKRGLGAFVLFVQRSGHICLDAAYTEEAYITPFLRLLAHALSLLSERGVKELYVTMKDAALRGLLERLTEEKPDLLHRLTLIAMEWNMEDARIGLEASDQAASIAAARETLDGMEILVPRLMRLMDILEARDVDSDLMMDEFPCLSVDDRIFVQVMPMDDRYEAFSLVFTAWLAYDLPEEDAKEQCDRINALCQFASAVRSGGSILLRYAVPESDVPVEEELFLTCLDTFGRELTAAGLALE